MYRLLFCLLDSEKYILDAPWNDWIEKTCLGPPEGTYVFNVAVTSPLDVCSSPMIGLLIIVKDSRVVMTIEEPFKGVHLLAGDTVTFRVKIEGLI